MQEEHKFDGDDQPATKLTASTTYGITDFDDDTEVSNKLTAFKAGLQSNGTIYQLLEAQSDSNKQKLSSAFGSDIDTSALDDEQLELLETASENIQKGLNAIYDKDLTKEEIDQLKRL